MIMEINENDFKTIEKYNKIDGEAVAADIRSRLKELIAGENFIPKIVIIQVGNDFASTKYVNRKRKVAVELGIDAEIKHFEEDITEAQLLAEIDKVNGNNAVHGFIVQMPLYVQCAYAYSSGQGLGWSVATQCRAVALFKKRALFCGGGTEQAS